VTSLRLGFAGSPSFAATVLARLHDQFPVTVVYAQPARPRGRGRKVVDCPVAALAKAYGLPLATPRTLRGAEEAARLAKYELDYLIVAAYGLILPRVILDTPRYGCLNVHASLLPRWRGAAPIERAIMAGDRATGVSIMVMDDGIDTGPVIARAACPIDEDDTGGTLTAKLAALGADTLIDCLRRAPDLTNEPQQAQDASYADKLTVADARIDWQSPAANIARQVRALTDRMPAFTHYRGERIRILAARAEASTDLQGPRPTPGTVLRYDANALTVACGAGSLAVTRVQLARGKGTPLPISAARNGYPALVAVGSAFDVDG